MIANLSSFIEFFAAVYVTMCISNDLFLRFWTPAHYRRIEEILKEHEFPGSSILYQQFFDKIKDISNNVNNLSIKRGAFMLSVCILLLIYMGVEPSISSKNILSAGLLCSLLPILIILCFHRIFFNKWKYVILSIAVVIGTFILTLYKHDEWSAIQYFVDVCDNYKLYIIVLIILYPIIHQLILNWLFSSVYRGYLSSIISNEYEKYISSKEGITKRKKELIDKEYLAAWNDSYFKDGEYDLSLKSFNDVFEARLIKALNPSTVKLIYSLLIFKLKCLLQRSKRQTKPIINQTLEGVITDEYKIPVYNQVLDFHNEYQDFLKWKRQSHSGYANLKSYCVQHGIKYKDMVAWVKVHNPTNTPGI